MPVGVRLQQGRDESSRCRRLRTVSWFPLLGCQPYFCTWERFSVAKTLETFYVDLFIKMTHCSLARPSQQRSLTARAALRRRGSALGDIRLRHHGDPAIPEDRERPPSARVLWQPFTGQRAACDRMDGRAAPLEEIHRFAFRPCYAFVENVAGLRRIGGRRVAPPNRPTDRGTSTTQAYRKRKTSEFLGAVGASDCRPSCLVRLLETTHDPDAGHPEPEYATDQGSSRAGSRSILRENRQSLRGEPAARKS